MVGRLAYMLTHVNGNFSNAFRKPMHFSTVFNEFSQKAKALTCICNSFGSITK
jgi:hypothetical protein